MLLLQNISYSHPDKTPLFEGLNLNLANRSKTALTGNNGTGKSTLLKIIAGIVKPSDGTLHLEAKPYYAPQIFGQYDHLTIAEALGIHQKLEALKQILEGNLTESNLNLLDDDWTIEERCKEALELWQLSPLSLTQKLEELSGGQKTKVFLAGISIHQAQLVLLDEPSNHLDAKARQILYDFITTTSATLLVVSHDRSLLNGINTVCELNKSAIVAYGGNYEFYKEQKQLKENALQEDIKSKEKALRKANEKKRESMERQQKLDARGRKKQEKAGVATIMLNTLKNNAEKSTAKIKNVHTEKIDAIFHELQELRSTLPDIDKMKFGFDNSKLHKGKTLFKANGINHAFKEQALWKENLDVEIISGERIALNGANGSGKTTLLKIVLGTMEPVTGSVYRAGNKTVYIDQKYSLINHELSVYEQAQHFNEGALQEHEVKIRLRRFLFAQEDWDKPCRVLSGGERMRLILCCLTISLEAPDFIVLDEPTNNLDIQNIKILTAAINEYQGTMLVVSHDEYFLEEINVARTLQI